MSEPKTKPVTELKTIEGQVPEFPVPLDLQRFDGEIVRVTVRCKVFGKRAWSRMRREHVDAVLAEEQELAKAEQEAKTAAAAAGEPAKRAVPHLDEILERGMRRDGEFFAQVATGWSLPEPCNADTLADLDDRFANALALLLEAYERTIYQGQLGNFAPLRAR